jgi:heat shock protein HslJ
MIVALRALLAPCIAGALAASPVAMAAEPAPLAGTAWTLAAMPDASLVLGTTATLQFAAGRVQGSDGCNRFSAPITIAGDALEVGPRGASTQMACPPAVMKQAQAFMQALQDARTWRVAGRELALLGADGAMLATFAAQSRDLAGTRWKVTGYNNGRQAVVSALGGTTLTMAFGDGGKVNGSAGCNRFSGRYTAAGDGKLVIDSVIATRKLCAQPEGVMEQERQFLDALRAVATARFEADRLELRKADGALAATLAK